MNWASSSQAAGNSTKPRALNDQNQQVHREDAPAARDASVPAHPRPGVAEHAHRADRDGAAAELPPLIATSRQSPNPARVRALVRCAAVVTGTSARRRLRRDLVDYAAVVTGTRAGRTTLRPAAFASYSAPSAAPNRSSSSTPPC